MESFELIWQRAAERKQGEANLKVKVSKPKTNKQLLKVTNAQWLEVFTKKVFQSGFVWRVVEQKWPDFQRVFFNFEINKILMMPADMLERKAEDKSIIRNFKKVQTIQQNALMIDELSQGKNSFHQWVAQWPSDNIIELWLDLKKRGARLGGNTGPYALRAMGKDTFLLSRDVEAYLREHKIIDGGLYTNRSLNAIQSAFNQWSQESGKSMQEVSQVLSMSWGENIR